MFYRTVNRLMAIFYPTCADLIHLFQKDSFSSDSILQTHIRSESGVQSLHLKWPYPSGGPPNGTLAALLHPSGGVSMAVPANLLDTAKSI